MKARQIVGGLRSIAWPGGGFGPSLICQCWLGRSLGCLLAAHTAEELFFARNVVTT